ncbi:MAG: hypothetical protein ABSH47_20550 [Bryobacteraceae bacterium]|jgi:hypothetical protein
MNETTLPLRIRGAGLALGVLTATFAFAFTVGCSFNFSVGTKKVTIGTRDEVRYSGTATEEQARALGASLKTQGYLQDQGVTVVLAKGSDGTIVSFVVQDGYWNNDDILPAFEQMVRTAAPAVGGFPIKLQYMNSKLEVKKETVVHPSLTVGANDEIRYSGTATEQEAKALGEALKSVGYLEDRGVTVLLSKGSGGTVVGFAVQDGAWNDEDTVATFEKIGRSVAPAVGGVPIKVRLLNTRLQKQKEIAVS